MQTKRTCWILATMTWIGLEGAAHIVLAQQTADMPGMENSVGYLSSGTSIEPKTTSESSPVQRQFGRQGVMFRTMLSLEPLTITKRKPPTCPNW
ncbi:MAG: hypothetical protein DMG12_09370 [Acidobacteria bacterium]|nr:MAG: hypothetical protein DMG12_09370 [Acidobacteriota bacterium]